MSKCERLKRACGPAVGDQNRFEALRLHWKKGGVYPCRIPPPCCLSSAHTSQIIAASHQKSTFLKIQLHEKHMADVNRIIPD